ncbi:MAG: DoxX family protein [Myxococcales bacterium]|nr:DoxX family protein [Myxococcales bacterium]
MDTTIAPLAANSDKPNAIRAWTGHVLSGLAVLFLMFDVTIKLMGHPSVAEASAKLGLPHDATKPIALVLLACLVPYVVKRTAPLGAVLLTGYLGGAVLVHVRVGDPLFSHTLFPIYVGAFLWAGLYLRDARVRRLVGPE